MNENYNEEDISVNDPENTEKDEKRGKWALLFRVGAYTAILNGFLLAPLLQESSAANEQEATRALNENLENELHLLVYGRVREAILYKQKDVNLNLESPTVRMAAAAAIQDAETEKAQQKNLDKLERIDELLNQLEQEVRKSSKPTFLDKLKEKLGIK